MPTNKELPVQVINMEKNSKLGFWVCNTLFRSFTGEKKKKSPELVLSIG